MKIQEKYRVFKVNTVFMHVYAKNELCKGV